LPTSTAGAPTSADQPRTAEKVRAVSATSKFCPKCGSQIGADGKCPSCA
jgi:NADH pyrophosphatase NudC (nudix superfamily)